VFESINSLRTQLNELEQLLLTDAAQLKAHVSSHLAMAQTTQEQCVSIGNMIATLREERAKLVHAKTI
jgi:hypothetical protein